MTPSRVAEQISGVSDAEVVLLHRSGYPAHSAVCDHTFARLVERRDSIQLSRVLTDRNYLRFFIYGNQIRHYRDWVLVD